ncbi:MAG: hypothetical protein H7201_09905 [Candidatus Saccharibacteria bacterium]|nr:hypothetical protein [Microbacteriaceae bacterium]
MKNSLKKVTASVVTLMFAIGLSLVAAIPASAAGETNNVTYWQTPGTGEICTKVEPGGTTWSLSSAALPAGSSWTKVIVKAGSTGTSVTTENTAYYTDATYKYPAAEPTASWTPVADLASTVFRPASGKDISHVIYCSAPTPSILVTAVSPTFTDAECTESGVSSTPGYTIPTTTGVQYQQSSDGTAFADVAAGSYAAVVGSKLWVKPVAQDGYTLSSSSTFGPHTFSAAGCFEPPTLGLLTPKASSTPIVCGTAGSYTLVNDEGVIWLVDGMEKPAGTYDVSRTSTVRGVATSDPSKAGLEADAQTEWTFAFTQPNCELTTLALPGSNGTLAFTGSNGTLAGGLLLGFILMIFGAGAMMVNHVRRRTN